MQEWLFHVWTNLTLKLLFTLTVKHPREYTVLSNTLVSSEDTDMRGNTTTTFITTPKMSTYLVSVIISKFVVALTGNEDQYEFKIFTRQSVRNLTNKVVGPYYSKIIAKLNDFTGVTYENISNIQCYQVAINDYYPYSMGEFGLFMYRESDILDEGDKTSPRDTQNILMTMAYKLSHQWFGGDISTKWWSDVWANEAVSTYLKYFIPHQINNEFDLAYQFVVEVIQNALQLDALPVIRPFLQTNLMSRLPEIFNTN
ncbi:hypothetical protein NQ314_006144 [Rhamnusium bicolor]|uniref:Aminopeptidase N n=1 Tax=Rhamnusium bicolor TaxID=1586634 RepID=A0AAV8Z9J4_9CUCU|nr:hypothetical protein NQ314_006144 [Rhamnusium bicolor]